MLKYKYLNILISVLVVASLVLGANFQASAQQQASAPQQVESIKKGPTPQPPQGAGENGGNSTPQDRVTPAERQAAADRNAALGLLPGLAQPANIGNRPSMNMPDPSVNPHYFGPFANYANSPLPRGPITNITLDNGGSGYTAPTVNILDVYGTGLGAAASATVDAGGVITGITLDNGGDGYSAPVIQILDSTGTGALATPILGGTPNSLTGGIRKFVDALPGLTPAGQNALGNYIPIATADKTSFGPAFNATYPADYYEIALVQYTQQLHSDLPATTLRGYVQLETPQLAADLLAANPAYVHVQLFYPDGTPILYADSTPVYAVDTPHYLGPAIIAAENAPVRLKFYNFLPKGQGGDLFIPVDTTVMGAGEGPLQADGVTPCNPDLVPSNCEPYTQNRATIHLHGALVPWISDGTPHQWTTPAGENTVYPQGVSVQNVPDMPNPGDGSLTFYYNNQQSARLMFYHDHAYGITRLNVYAGEAAGFVLTDQVEQDLINGTNVSGVNPGNAMILPGVGTPLIFQDKTFVDETTIAAQDPTWKWGTGAIDPATGRRAPRTGDLWVPSVYMPAQNPYDLAGANAFGRWMYGPWFNPPTLDVINLPAANEYYDPGCDAAVTWCEPPVKPVMPTPSMGMEAFNDTGMVNGAIYPYMEVDPTTVRFRILNAANDRFVNLQMYIADPTVVTADGRTNTEVKMVPAVLTPGFPANWSTDGRVGGVPDPATAGPAWIQIGTEGGFLPAPVLIPNQPVNWNMNPTAFNVGNVTDHSLLLGPAERADVIVDFSQYAGQTLIVYNDAPAAFPALDPRYDYYTGNPSQMDTGGAPTTQAGYGPNTRTFMQIRVRGTAAGTPPANYYNPATLAALQSVFAKTATKPGVFETSHPNDPIIVPQAAYDSAYNASFPGDAASQYVQIGDAGKTFTPVNTSTPVSITFETKAMHDEMGAAYDIEFGRMSSMLGLDVPNAAALTQNVILSGYASSPVDLMQNSIAPLGSFGDGTQIWKIMHNGVDTHPIHFHLFNVQLINRVSWDGALLPPEPNEIGWKETVRINPLEDTIIAMRPVATTQPFEVPNSIRMIDPTKPAGYRLMGGPGGMITPTLNRVTVYNHPVNYGWEYVWHCHILSHEEMDMMHALAFGMNPDAPSLLTATGTAGTVSLSWTDNSINETDFTIKRSADGVTTTFVMPSVTGPARGALVTYDDTTATPGKAYSYQVLASNIIGDTAAYAGTAIGYPKKSVDSLPSNAAANMIAVLSIVRASPNPTSATSVDFTVTFSEPVSGVVAGDFSLAASTVTGPAITGILPAAGPAAVYTVTVDTGTNSGTLQLDMTNPAFGGPYTTGQVYTVEKTPALVSSIVAASANPTSMSGVNYTVTFNKPVTGVDVTDFSLTLSGLTGSSVRTVTGSGATYTVTVLTGSGSGTLRLDLTDNNSILDLTGAALGGPVLADGNFTTGDVYTVDTVPPTVVSSVPASANPSKAASVNFTVTFSEAVTGVDKTDFSLTATGITGASVTSVSGAGATRTVAVNTGTGNGTLRLNVLDNNTIIDALSNPLSGTGNTPYSAGQSYTIDKNGPTVVSIARAYTSPNAAATVAFTVTFSEPVTSVFIPSFSLTTTGVTGASVASVSGSGATRTVMVNTGSGSGTIRLDVVDNDAILDTAGNPLGGVGIGNGSFSTGQAYTIDKTPPTVASSVRASADPTSAASVTFTVTFSEAVTGVDVTDFALTAPGITGASVTSVSGSGTTYTITVNTGTGTGTLRLDLIDNDSIKDIAGASSNPLGGAGAGNGDFTTGEAYTVNRGAPSVVSITRTYLSPNAASSVAFTVTFSESVTGVDMLDFNLATTGVTGASIASVSGSGTTRTVLVNTGTNSGTIRLDLIDNDSIKNANLIPLGGPGLGNGDFLTGQTYTIDKTPPTVVSSVRASADPSKAASVNFTVTFSEAVTGVDVTDFALTAPGLTGASVTSVSGSGTTYTVAVNTGTGNGTLRLDLIDNDSIKDIAGASSNPLGGAGAGNGDFITGQSYTIDQTAPTVVSIARVYANPNAAATVAFTVTFSEPVTSVFIPSFSLTTTGVTGASVASVSGSGATRTVMVNTGSGSGTIRLDVVDSDAIVDAAGNPLGGPGLGNGDFLTGQTYTIDKTPPTVVSIVRASADPTSAASVTFTVTFSEAVTGVDVTDFALTAPGITGASVTSVSGSGTTYTITVNTGTGTGTLRLDLIDNDSIKDIAGASSNPLGGAGAGNGDFTTGEVYTVR